jgi:hypothetical protein
MGLLSKKQCEENCWEAGTGYRGLKHYNKENEKKIRRKKGKERGKE